MQDFKNKITMAIEDWHTVENEDGDYEFAYGTVDFLSTRPNSHKHKISEEVLKEYAPSVINKWVIAYYDENTRDVTTHVSNQHIIGRIPEQEVKYRYDNDGYLVASVDVVLSKLYATDVYNLFKQHNYRSVSIEELVGFSKDTEDFEDGLQEKIVEGFNITAISVLGLSYRPSVPNANIQLTKMSEINEDNLQDAEKEYVKYSQNKNNVGNLKIILEKLDDIAKNVEKLSKEEKMADLENKQVEELESVETSEEKVETKVEEKLEEKQEEKLEEKQEEEMACGGDGEEKKMEEAVENAEDSKDDEEEKEDSDDSEEKMAEQMSELTKKLEEAEEKVQKYEAELSELKEFKKTVEMSKKQEVINQTLAEVKDFLSEEEYSEAVSKAEACSYEEIGAWKNETRASIVDKAIQKINTLSSNKEEGVLDMGVPKEVNVKTSIFD